MQGAPTALADEGTVDRGGRRTGLTVAGILVALFCSFAAMGSVLPVLPLYVRGTLKAGDVAVGVVVTATAVAAVVARPIAGRLADTRGRRRMMIVGAALVSAAGLLYFAAHTVAALVAARLILGVGEGFVFTPAALWIVSLAPTDRRGQLVGFAGLSMWTGLTVGPLLGASLLEAGGYSAVWATVTAIPAAGALLTAWLAEPDRPTQAARGQLVPRATVRPGISLALGSVGYASLAAFVVLLLAERGIGGGALAFTAYGSAYVGVRVAGGRLPDRFGPRRVVLYAATVEAIGLVVVTVAPGFWTALLGAVLTGGGLSLLYPSLAVMVLDRTAPGEQGAAIGAYTSFWDVGVGLAGPLTGAVASVAGYGAAFLTAAACALAAGILAYPRRAAGIG